MTNTEIEEDGTIVIYPNPANTFITFHLPEEKMLYEINILDDTGKVIRNQCFQGGKQYMQIRDLANGTYLIEIITAIDHMIAPIIVSH